MKLEQRLKIFLDIEKSSKLGHSFLIYGNSFTYLKRFFDLWLENFFTLWKKQFHQDNRLYYPHLFSIEPSSKSGIIPIKKFKEFQNSFFYKVRENEKKIGVIYHADCLNMESQNSFLKFLEEPTRNTIFFLLTDDKSKLSHTIQSRCQKIPLFDYFKQEEKTSFLEDFEQFLDNEDIFQNTNSVIRFSAKFNSVVAQCKDFSENYAENEISKLKESISYKLSREEMNIITEKKLSLKETKFILLKKELFSLIERYIMSLYSKNKNFIEMEETLKTFFNMKKLISFGFNINFFINNLFFSIHRLIK